MLAVWLDFLSLHRYSSSSAPCMAVFSLFQIPEDFDYVFADKKSRPENQDLFAFFLVMESSLPCKGICFSLPFSREFPPNPHVKHASHFQSPFPFFPVFGKIPTRQLFRPQRRMKLKPFPKAKAVWLKIYSCHAPLASGNPRRFRPSPIPILRL